MKRSLIVTLFLSATLGIALSQGYFIGNTGPQSPVTKIVPQQAVTVTDEQVNAAVAGKGYLTNGAQGPIVFGSITSTGPATNAQMLYQGQTITFTSPAFGEGDGNLLVLDTVTKQVQRGLGTRIEGGKLYADMGVYTNSLKQGTTNLVSDAGSKINGLGITNTQATLSGDYTTDSALRVGSMEFQPYGLNNTWLSDNIYFDGGSFMRRANGYGTLFYMANGGFEVRNATSGAAGGVTPTTRMQINAGGDVRFGGDVVAGPTVIALNTGDVTIKKDLTAGTNSVISDSGSKINGLGITNQTTYQGRTLTGTDRFINTIEDSTTHAAVKIGLYKPSYYVSTPGIWFNEAAPDDGNYSFSRAGNTSILNASGTGPTELRVANDAKLQAYSDRVHLTKKLTVSGSISSTNLVVGTNANFTVDDSGNVVVKTIAGDGSLLTGVLATGVTNQLLNVKSMGAVGDGVADDTAVLQAALNQTTNGIEIPSGTYLVTSTLEPKGSTIHIKGAGLWKSVIKAGTPGMTVMHIAKTLSPFWGNIEDLSIDGAKIAKNGLVLGEGDYTAAGEMRNVEIQQCTNNGVEVVRTVGFQLNNCFIHNNHNGIFSGRIDNNVYPTTFNVGDFTDISRNTNAGVYMTYGNKYDFKDVIIENNKGPAVWIADTNAHQNYITKNITFDHCWFEVNNIDTTWTNKAQLVFDAGTTYPLQHISVINCFIEGNGYDYENGVYFGPGTYTFDENIFINPLASTIIVSNSPTVILNAKSTRTDNNEHALESPQEYFWNTTPALGAYPNIFWHYCGPLTSSQNETALQAESLWVNGGDGALTKALFTIGSTNGTGAIHTISGAIALNTNAAPANVTVGTTVPDRWFTIKDNTTGTSYWVPAWLAH